MAAAAPRRPAPPLDCATLRLRALDAAPQRLGGEIKSVEQRLARLEGVVANLPSTRVMLTAVAASQVTLLGITFLILRYAPK